MGKKQEINYKKGNTVVHCDFDKTVVTNAAGKSHVKANIEDLFGVGEYDKLVDHAYIEEVKKGPGPNPISKTYTLVSGYTPEIVRKEFKEEGINKYFSGLSDND